MSPFFQLIYEGETMVSDQEIAQGVESVLRQADPNSVTTLGGVIQQLEAKLGQNLSNKAGFIRDQINVLIQSHSQQQPQQPLPQPQQLHHHLPTPKDHFALRNHPQFPSTHHQQFHPHFALQHHTHHRPDELIFRQPQPPPLQPQPRPAHVQPQPPLTKPEAFAPSATATPEKPKQRFYFLLSF